MGSAVRGDSRGLLKNALLATRRFSFYLCILIKVYGKYPNNVNCLKNWRLKCPPNQMARFG